MNLDDKPTTEAVPVVPGFVAPGGAPGAGPSLDDLEDRDRKRKLAGDEDKKGRKGAAKKPAEPVVPAWTPENVRPVVAAPFNMLALRTGFEGFRLDDREATLIAAPAAVVANTYLAVSPGVAAIAQLAAAMTDLAITKGVLYVEWKKERDKNKAKKSAEPVTPTDTQP